MSPYKETVNITIAINEMMTVQIKYEACLENINLFKILEKWTT